MEAAIITYFIYKFLALLVGAFVVYLGYKLFMKGIVEYTSDIEAGIKGYNIKIARAAPGTFFALFGSIIIIWSIFKKIDVQAEKTPIITHPIVRDSTTAKNNADSIPPPQYIEKFRISDTLKKK